MATTVDDIEGLGDYIAENELDDIEEPSLDGEQAKPEEPVEEPVESEQSDAEAVEDEPEAEVPELADSLEGLAEQIELDVDDLKALNVTLDVNGESRSMTIADALEQVSQSEAVTVQSEQLAESQRTHNQHVEQATAVWQDRLQRIEAVVEALEADAAEDPVDLNYILMNEGTEEYLMAKERIDQRSKRLGDAQTARQQAVEEQQQFNANKLAEHRASEGQVLLKKYPELSDPEKATVFDNRFKTAGAAYGFSPEELAQYMGGYYDVRYINILLDAHDARLAKDKQPALKQKLKALPKVRKPGAARGADEVSLDKSRALRKRIRETGGNDPDSVAELFSDL